MGKMATRFSFYEICIIIIMICISSSTFSQSVDATKAKVHKFTVYAGFGPNYYFNNLVVAKSVVNELNYSFVGRIMWEPEYNLSLGIESGYNRLYTIDEEFRGAKGTIRIVNSAIPIQLVISMKFFENIYANFTMGQSILLNKVSTSDYGGYNASATSLGDFSGAIGYRKLLKERIYLGAEVKYFTSSKLQDKNISLVFMAGYRL